MGTERSLILNNVLLDMYANNEEGSCEAQKDNLSWMTMPSGFGVLIMDQDSIIQSKSRLSLQLHFRWLMF
ncbi:hypothetical protein Sjap_001016 [Stephania japonica]|uniref:Uncharacterized protein n=1 Tax=Stephania japonica TaxID=461633 RepID=A0AAP0PUM4_9MAGN